MLSCALSITMLKTFNGPNMTVEKEGTPDAPQTAGLLTASTSNNVVDCTSPTPGLATEQDEEPMDQSLQKVDKEPNPPVRYATYHSP